MGKVCDCESHQLYIFVKKPLAMINKHKKYIVQFIAYINFVNTRICLLYLRKNT